MIDDPSNEQCGGNEEIDSTKSAEPDNIRSRSRPKVNKSLVFYSLGCSTSFLEFWQNQKQFLIEILKVTDDVTQPSDTAQLFVVL